ncbi:MAG: hypothetical protein ABSD68_02830 [Candidatus Micrarchaeales archaeon]
MIRREMGVHKDWKPHVNAGCWVRGEKPERAFVGSAGGGKFFLTYAGRTVGRSFGSAEEAMKRRYLISAHGHFAIEVNGRNEKAWLVARVGKGIGRKYEGYNKKIKLVVVPPFNDLILGTRIGERTAEHTPLFRREVFDWKSSKIYDLKRNKFEMKDETP